MVKNDFSKILNLEQLQFRLSFFNRSILNIVFTNGVFDIIHVYHVRLLEFSKSKGDILVVGVNSDKSTKNLKGLERPINPIEERMEILASFKCVDFVVSFEEDTPYELIKQIRPDIICKGGDYSKENVSGANIVGEDNVYLFPYNKNKSTTKIIETINKINVIS